MWNKTWIKILFQHFSIFKNHLLFYIFITVEINLCLIIQSMPTINSIQFQEKVKSIHSYTPSPFTTPPFIAYVLFFSPFNGDTVVRLWKGITTRLIRVIPFLQVFREQYRCLHCTLKTTCDIVYAIAPGGSVIRVYVIVYDKGLTEF